MEVLLQAISQQHTLSQMSKLITISSSLVHAHHPLPLLLITVLLNITLNVPSNQAERMKFPMEEIKNINSGQEDPDVKLLKF